MFQENLQSAVVEGIKTIGVGKRGSKSLSAELVQRILGEFREGHVLAAAKGAFFGALFIKGVTEEEKFLADAFPAGAFEDYSIFVKALASDAPANIQALCARILKKETLDKDTSQQLGDFLFSALPGDGLRGLAASVLRVRYETPDEFEGLLASLQTTIELPFQEEIPDGEPIVQIAEPFDGVKRSYFVTPLLARHVQGLGYRVVNLMGRNSGPKFGNNLSGFVDAQQDLDATLRLKSRKGLAKAKPSFGWYLHQLDMSQAMDRWVDLRRQTVKRPFMSTLERFVNPVNAQIVIASAFHPPYGEKMLTIAERAGFPGIIIIRNGLEGTLAFPIQRAVKILCSVKQKDGTYVREEIKFYGEEYLGKEAAIEERLENPSMEENIHLIEEYHTKGKTSYAPFDSCVKATCAGITKGIEWIRGIINQ